VCLTVGVRVGDVRGLYAKRRAKYGVMLLKKSDYGGWWRGGWLGRGPGHYERAYPRRVVFRRDCATKVRCEVPSKGHYGLGRLVAEEGRDCVDTGAGHTTSIFEC
jgi:hypothetical protein